MQQFPQHELIYSNELIDTYTYVRLRKHTYMFNI